MLFQDMASLKVYKVRGRFKFVGRSDLLDLMLRPSDLIDLRHQRIVHCLDTLMFGP